MTQATTDDIIAEVKKVNQRLESIESPHIDYDHAHARGGTQPRRVEGTGEHRSRDDERPNGTPGRTREDAEVDPCPANPPPLSAHRFITGLNRRRARRVTQEIGDLRNYPFFAMPHDLAKLKGRKGYYRIRIGDLRVIFRVFEEEKEIYIEKIDHRGKIYK